MPGMKAVRLRPGNGPEKRAVETPIHRWALHAAAPGVTQILMNTTVRMFPNSAAAKGDKYAKAAISAEAHAIAEVMRGIHF